MSDPVKQVAMRILDLREISDYTVDKMAEVLNVPVEEYRKYESGEVDMPISFLVKIGEVFHVDMTELLTGEAPRLNVLSVTRAGKGQEETSCHDQYVYRNLAYNFVGRKIEPMYVVVDPEDNKTLTPSRIMRAVMDHAGVQSPAHTVMFSLPVESVAGLRSVMAAAGQREE